MARVSVVAAAARRVSQRRLFSSKQAASAGNLQERLVALCRHRGFVYPGSDIYGGLANSFDYGPLGTLMKKNIQDRWWFEFVQKRPNCVGLDSSVLMSSAVWTASGHVDNFTDPMTVCSHCNARVRVDQLLESKLTTKEEQDAIASLALEDMDALLTQHAIACPNCGKVHAFQPAKKFNLLFRTNVGATEETCNWIYLRPETAQGAYINFAHVQSTMRKKLPFGIGQMGKSFRNEISPGHFLFRTREFEQLELQFFTHPSESDEWYEYWVNECYNFLLKYGVKPDSIRKHEHAREELAHYARATTDIQFKYPFGWSELWGIANRTDYDLRKHMDASGKSLLYQDAVTKEEYLPHVVEPALGLGRVLLSMLLDAYDEEEVLGRKRTVLRLHPEISPYRFAVLPLVKKEPLTQVAQQLFEDLAYGASVDYDVAGSIGRRYRRQDEIGTPMCLTVDFDTLEDQCVTVRDRDTMEQKRVPIAQLLEATRATRPTFECLGATQM
jgi:glycyl-tRNA synthetase